MISANVAVRLRSLPLDDARSDHDGRLPPPNDARGDHGDEGNRCAAASVQSPVVEHPFRGSEALAAGLITRGRLRGPGFRRLFDDVYVAADVPVDLALRSRAAYLLVADRGVLAGYSAAEILGASCGPGDAPAEVAVPGGCLLRQSGLRVHRGLLAADETTTVDGVGVTTPVRTAYDLARRAPSLVEAVVAVDALAVPEPGRARPRRPPRPGEPFLPAHLLRLRNRYLGARNSRRLPEVVALADPLAESPMETRTRLALVLNGLPRPVSQFAVRDGRHCHYLDLGYPEYRVGIEYDGGEHLTPERARRDLERQHRISQLDWVLVRPRAGLVLNRQYLVAVDVARELDRAAERLGLPTITAGVAPWR